jgi:hypothetical protein
MGNWGLVFVLNVYLGNVHQWVLAGIFEHIRGITVIYQSGMNEIYLQRGRLELEMLPVNTYGSSIIGKEIN